MIQILSCLSSYYLFHQIDAINFIELLNCEKHIYVFGSVKPWYLLIPVIGQTPRGLLKLLKKLVVVTKIDGKTLLV